MDWNLKAPSRGFKESEQEPNSNTGPIGGSTSLGGHGNKGDFSVDSKLGRVVFGNESVDNLPLKMASGSLKRAQAAASIAIQAASCQVDGCQADLSGWKPYHRRHNVCGWHSKTPEVEIGGHKQRFCQQCSRFHSLEEFDEFKRSCRKRLAGHNQRRRASNYQGPFTPDKQNSSKPDPNSRGEEDSEGLQMQMHQHSDATFSISDREHTSGTAPDGGVSYMEESMMPLNEMGERLVALQKLYLRSCELLMQLPPEIGELTNLEVLDLEGTEILCLPKEIANLVKLTCLRLSFYGYANPTVIPRKVLPNLSCLNALIIDVIPYGEWWDVEVEAIIDDLGLVNFRFIVGRCEEHFISHLLRDIEEEFNNRKKLEKGLKYVNGDRIPNEITQTSIDSEQFYQGNDGRAESENFQDYDEAIVLGSVERLMVRYMKNMESICKGPVGKGSMSSLKSLALHACPNLITLFTIDMLSNLTNLEELIVEDCPKIDSVVSLKNSGSIKVGAFSPKLEENFTS
ncbi:hypothetical protein Vadar_003295 [Vaccinium darrowii]|uniref:Uncharacterized protein n=1 Tax=Vaccinium darrowii TaxID=229202 RepID=A0ACB7XWG5_9ERIC|nr:hypothetical protein Vadar_003295 [Vaccinium darrowii]